MGLARHIEPPGTLLPTEDPEVLVIGEYLKTEGLDGVLSVDGIVEDGEEPVVGSADEFVEVERLVT